METNDLVDCLVDKTHCLEVSNDENPPTETLNSSAHFPIVAKILCEKPLNNNAVKTTLAKAWGISPRTHINVVSQSTLVFLLDSEEDRRRIWRQSPWSFRAHLVVSQPWLPEEALDEVNLTRFQIWAQVIGLPVILVNKKTAQSVGNMIGKFICTDLSTESHRWRRALRIRIELSIEDSLKDHVIFKAPENRDLVLELRYERLSDFCHVCGLVGHKLNSCPEKPQITSTDNHPFKFGPWIKVENSPIPNPFMNTNKKMLPENTHSQTRMCKSKPKWNPTKSAN
ncbi:UNVERIFIED_CONTAM: hypothetical protein Sradi_0452100 [Sesamum radiatum]|uniref:CCHC-type domain-containing protein n=1 Tax=Sesamum radiatum TaxID=300843 RepID=A0AAW2W6G3_SESRA